MTDRKTILCIDDDAFTRQMIATYLTNEGFDVIEGDSGHDLKKICDQQHVDLIILDLMLPDTDGIELIQFIRGLERTKYLPIIMISAKGEDIDRIIGLETGADDYMAKPFVPRELKARVMAVLKRTQNLLNDNEQASPCIEFGDWRLDPAQYQAFDTDGKSADLTTSEFMILSKLAHNAQRTLPRDFLFELTRDMASESFDRAVDVQITRIRKKLKDDARRPKYIKTIRGVGYLFCAQIKQAS